MAHALDLVGERWSLLIVAILSLPATPSALTAAHNIDQYGHTSWALRDGTLTGYPRAIAQTTDGYLWLATEFGLIRYDGARFVDVSVLGGAALPSRLVSALAAGHDGSSVLAKQAFCERTRILDAPNSREQDGATTREDDFEGGLAAHEIVDERPVRFE